VQAGFVAYTLFALPALLVCSQLRLHPIILRGGRSAHAGEQA
jgi:hypothetical protein